MPMPLCHILRARLRQQGKGDKSTLPVRDNSTLRLHWCLCRGTEPAAILQLARGVVAKEIRRAFRPVDFGNNLRFGVKIKESETVARSQGLHVVRTVLWIIHNIVGRDRNASNARILHSHASRMMRS